MESLSNIYNNKVQLFRRTEPTGNVVSVDPHTHTHTHTHSGVSGTQAAQQDLRVHLVHWSSHMVGRGFGPRLLVHVVHS